MAVAMNPTSRGERANTQSPNIYLSAPPHSEGPRETLGSSVVSLVLSR